MPETKEQISYWDIVKSIDSIHNTFAEKYKTSIDKLGYTGIDARSLIFFNISSLAENLSLTIVALGFAKTNGMHSKEWWHKWAGLPEPAFQNIPDFDTYVDDQFRQIIHRIQEQLATTSQIYLEAFIRNTARQLEIEHTTFWKLRDAF